MKKRRHKITVHIRDGKGELPLWSVVVFVLTFLIGCSGWVWGMVQKGADVEHKLIRQDVSIIDHRLTGDEDFITRLIASNADIRTDIAVIKNTLLEIEKRLK